MLGVGLGTHKAWVDCTCQNTQMVSKGMRFRLRQYAQTIGCGCGFAPYAARRKNEDGSCTTSIVLEIGSMYFTVKKTQWRVVHTCLLLPKDNTKRQIYNVI